MNESLRSIIVFKKKEELIYKSFAWKVELNHGLSGLRATTSFDQTLDLCPEKRPNSLSYFQ